MEADRPVRSSPVAAAIAACRTHLRAIALFSALLNLLYIAPTLYMLQVYDRVMASQSEVTLFFLTIVLVFALAVLSFLDWVRNRLLARSGLRLDRLLGGPVLDATFAAGNARSGGTVRELDVLRQALTGPGIVALLDAPWTPVYALICFMLHPWLGALAVVGAGVLLFLAWGNERATSAGLKAAGDAATLAYANQEAAIMAKEAVRALGMRRALVQRNLIQRRAMMNAQTEATFAGSRWAAISKFSRLTIQSLALGIGALLAINNLLSPGAVFAAMFLVGRALAPIDQVINSWKSISQARAAHESLTALLGKEVEPQLQMHLPEPTGRLDVGSIGFRLETGQRQVFENVSFQLLPGTCLALLGASGAGKSTLARCLAGAAPVSSGTIRFDGSDQGQWDPEQLARHIGFLPQDIFLFEGTIRENIARFRTGNEAAVDEAVVAAARKANAHEMIVSLPGGYEYKLGVYGRGLSAGQSQRIALARALFGQPRYVILDEPNAHLDAQSDLLLLATLAELKRSGVTIVLAVHRLNVMPVVDQILVLQEPGQYIIGSRDDVIARIAPKPRRSTQEAAA